MRVVLVGVSVATTKYQDHKQLGKEMVSFAFISTSQSTPEGSQDRGSNRVGTLR